MGHFKDWLAQEVAFDYLDKSIDAGMNYGKSLATNMFQFRKEPKPIRDQKIANAWEATQRTISSIHNKLVQDVQSIDLTTPSPLINQLIKILKIASKIIGFDKIAAALAIEAPKTMLKPLKVSLDTILTTNGGYREIANSIINFLKLGPAFAMTGVFKLLLPWQMNWFNWSFEQAMKYNVILTYGLYFLFVLAMSVDKSRWFNWFHRMVLSIFPEEFRVKESVLMTGQLIAF